MEETDAVKALAALAQPVRLRLFRALVVTGPQGLTPGTMAQGWHLRQRAVVHLKELANAGLVTSERASRHLVYRAAFPRMTALLAYLTDNCCEGAACAVQDAACVDC